MASDAVARDGEQEPARPAAEAEQARRRQRTSVVAGVLAAGLVAGVVGFLALRGSDETPPGATPPGGTLSGGTPPGATSSGATPSGARGSCSYPADGSEPARPVQPPPPAGTAGTVTATMTTDRGVVTLELLGGQAPCAVGSLVSLAAQSYFDGTPCHRLTSGGSLSVLQCGDPTGTGSGGPGYTFPDEALQGASYPRGTVAMANAGPGTNGSQFFLVYRDSQLPPAYTPFGRITGGLEVLDAVAAAGSTPPGDGTPTTPVTVTTLRTAPA